MGRVKEFFKRIGGFFKKHIKLIIVLVIILGVVLFQRQKAIKMAQEQAAIANQPVTATVDVMDLQQSVSITGNLTANETKTVTSTLGGTGVTGVKVSKVNYEVGDYVEEGEVVVEFDGDDYNRKIAELGAQYSIDNANSAIDIEQYQQKIMDTEKDIEDTQKKIEDTQKELDDRQTVYENVKQLYDDYEKYKDAYANRYNTENNALMAKYGMGIVQFISDYESKRDSIADYEYKIATDQFNLGLYQEQIAVAQQKQDYATTYTQQDAYNDVYESMDKTQVKAPISGYILSMNVAEGNNYSQGNAVFTIADTSGFVVEATVNEYDVSKIAEGLPASVKFEATGDEEFTGTVDFVAVASEATISSTSQSAASASTSSSSTATYKVKIVLDSADERLRVGMTAKASVILNSVSNVMAVPYDCVQDAEDGSKYVTVINDDGTTKDVTVTTGLESDYYVEIKGDGIEKGTTVEAVVSDAPSTDVMDYMTME